MSRSSSNNKSPHSVNINSNTRAVKELDIIDSSVVGAVDIQSSSSPSI
jgi:hypothetical protein